MSNVRLSVQKVKSLKEVDHYRLHKLFGEWARFAAWSLKREQGGLKWQVNQTLVKIAIGTFEAEHIDGMTDALRSRVRCGYRIEMVVNCDLAIQFPGRGTHVHLQYNIMIVSR
jgi:hypothetical protein